ncbi:MAG: hypothetical protein ACO3ZK_15470 [Rubrivivax sp.]
MDVIELRDPDLARRYLIEGLWLQRAVKPTARTVRGALEWAMEVASAGHPLPPIGFVADVGNVAIGVDSADRQKEHLHLPGWPPALGRSYEDHVLGRLYSDWTFERAGDAVKKFRDKDRVRGVAYMVNQIRERAGLPGVLPRPRPVRPGRPRCPCRPARGGCRRFRSSRGGRPRGRRPARVAAQGRRARSRRRTAARRGRLAPAPGRRRLCARRRPRPARSRWPRRSSRAWTARWRPGRAVPAGVAPASCSHGSRGRLLL